MESESFLSLSKPGYAETRVLGSRFFGVASPANSPNDIQELVENQRTKYHDATHVCFAGRIGFGATISERISDDGEPKGTAGLPILKEIIGRKLTNTAVTVTRFFGGTKLGTGNLARAYAECAAASLSAAQVIERRIYQVLSVESAFDDQGIVYHISSKYDALVEPSANIDGATFEIRILFSKRVEFSAMLREESSGKIKISEKGTWIS